MEDQHLQSPNTKTPSTRAMNDANTLPAVKSLLTLLAPNSSRREYVSSLDAQVCMGWESWGGL